MRLTQSPLMHRHNFISSFTMVHMRTTTKHLKKGVLKFYYSEWINYYVYKGVAKLQKLDDISSHLNVGKSPSTPRFTNRVRIWNGNQVKREVVVIMNSVFANLVSLTAWFWLLIIVFCFFHTIKYAIHITNRGVLRNKTREYT